MPGIEQEVSRSRSQSPNITMRGESSASPAPHRMHENRDSSPEVVLMQAHGEDFADDFESPSSGLKQSFNGIGSPTESAQLRYKQMSDDYLRANQSPMRESDLDAERADESNLNMSMIEEEEASQNQNATRNMNEIDPMQVSARRPGSRAFHDGDDFDDISPDLQYPNKQKTLLKDDQKAV